MNAPTIIDLVEAGAKMLRAAKETFFDDSTIKEAETISKSQLTGSVETLKEQVNTQRQVIDKLVEQIKANKEMIKIHIFRSEA